ncbi:MAG: rhodanese-like domain-containing protein [Acidimicrobiales bacterium]
MSGSTPEQAGLGPTGAVELLQGGAVLVDVREDDEWVAGHAPQARHVPVSEIASAHSSLPQDRVVICVCHLGGRSARAVAELRACGLDARNLEGGMAAWASAGLPVVDDLGRPGTIA